MCLFKTILAGLLLITGATALATTDRPNILVIWGDDIGWSNLSAYHRGMLGGSTPNIDRLAKEGAMFTDYYGEQSCTAGGNSLLCRWQDRRYRPADPQAHGNR